MRGQQQMRLMKQQLGQRQRKQQQFEQQLELGQPYLLMFGQLIEQRKRIVPSSLLRLLPSLRTFVMKQRV
jgi:hypothetical protein